MKSQFVIQDLSVGYFSEEHFLNDTCKSVPLMENAQAFDSYTEAQAVIDSIGLGEYCTVVEIPTYDVHYNSDTASNNEGFGASFEYCKNYIEMWNGSNHSYFEDYKGGTVSIVCSDGVAVHEEEIKKTTPDQIKQFLTERRGIVSINEIEKRAGIPRYTLQKFVNGEKYRILTPEQIEKVLPVLGRIGFKPS